MADWDPADTGRFSRICSSCGFESKLPLQHIRMVDYLTGEIEMVPFCLDCRKPFRPEEGIVKEKPMNRAALAAAQPEDEAKDAPESWPTHCRHGWRIEKGQLTPCPDCAKANLAQPEEKSRG